MDLATAGAAMALRTGSETDGAMVSEEREGGRRKKATRRELLGCDHRARTELRGCGGRRQRAMPGWLRGVQWAGQRMSEGRQRVRTRPGEQRRRA